jgi:hypothetical protein
MGMGPAAADGGRIGNVVGLGGGLGSALSVSGGSSPIQGWDFLCCDLRNFKNGFLEDSVNFWAKKWKKVKKNLKKSQKTCFCVLIFPSKLK